MPSILSPLAGNVASPLFGSGGGGGGIPAGLTTGLEAFWELEEASSATRVDQVAALNLTDNGGVTQGTGLVGNCAETNAIASYYLYKAVTGTPFAGSGSFGVSGWAYFNTLPSSLSAYFMCRMDRISSSGTNLDWFFQVLPNDATWDNQWYFGIYDSGGTLHQVQVTGPPVVSTWYYFSFYYDSTLEEVGLSIDNGTPVTASTGTITRRTNGDDLIFFQYSQAVSRKPQGRLDQVGYWSRKLTDSENTYLYNGGSGRSYAEISGV